MRCQARTPRTRQDVVRRHTCQKMIGGKTGMGSPGSRHHVSRHVRMGVALTLWTALILACSQHAYPCTRSPQGMIS